MELPSVKVGYVIFDDVNSITYHNVDEKRRVVCGTSSIDVDFIIKGNNHLEMDSSVTLRIFEDIIKPQIQSFNKNICTICVFVGDTGPGLIGRESGLVARTSQWLSRQQRNVHMSFEKRRHWTPLAKYGESKFVAQLEWALGNAEQSYIRLRGKSSQRQSTCKDITNCKDIKKFEPLKLQKNTLKSCENTYTDEAMFVTLNGLEYDNINHYLKQFDYLHAQFISNGTSQCTYCIIGSNAATNPQIEMKLITLLYERMSNGCNSFIDSPWVDSYEEWINTSKKKLIYPNSMLKYFDTCTIREYKLDELKRNGELLRQQLSRDYGRCLVCTLPYPCSHTSHQPPSKSRCKRPAINRTFLTQEDLTCEHEEPLCMLSYLKNVPISTPTLALCNDNNVPCMELCYGEHPPSAIQYSENDFASCANEIKDCSYECDNKVYNSSIEFADEINNCTNELTLSTTLLTHRSPLIESSHKQNKSPVQPSVARQDDNQNWQISLIPQECTDDQFHEKRLVERKAIRASIERQAALTEYKKKKVETKIAELEKARNDIIEAQKEQETNKTKFEHHRKNLAKKLMQLQEQKYSKEQKDLRDKEMAEMKIKESQARKREQREAKDRELTEWRQEKERQKSAQVAVIENKKVFSSSLPAAEEIYMPSTSPIPKTTKTLEKKLKYRYFFNMIYK
eukprot:GHVL01038870.1.p1 GENE.GHVL01038870.1~~GHVL01038870.1.p1  ORF type:complete len:679 (+),score=133.50 GHVL01038870.1:59-2095(+)